MSLEPFRERRTPTYVDRGLSPEKVRVHLGLTMLTDLLAFSLPHEHLENLYQFTAISSLPSYDKICHVYAKREEYV